jgi:hypothetical protein
MTKTVTLEQPIRRGESFVPVVEILSPSGTGWLRGVKLLDLAQMDASALTTVLPRITTPALTEQEIRNALSAPDLFQLGTLVADFLIPKSVRAESTDAPPE